MPSSPSASSAPILGGSVPESFHPKNPTNISEIDLEVICMTDLIDLIRGWMERVNSSGHMIVRGARLLLCNAVWFIKIESIDNQGQPQTNALPLARFLETRRLEVDREKLQ